MKLLKKTKGYLFVVLMSVFSLSFVAQVDYQVRIDELYSAADDSDGSGNEDPTWKVELTDNDAGPTNLSGCINASIAFNSWYTGGGTPFTSWFTRNNTNATSFSSSMECWEEDGCGFGCCDNNACTYSTGTFCNSDDAHAPAGGGNGSTGGTQTISFLTNPPCQESDYTLTISGDVNNGTVSQYAAKILVYWEPSTNSAGVISGDQSLCSGGDPTIITSTTAGNPGHADYGSWYTYQWQQDVGCTGTFVNIIGANAATYDPGVLTVSTCYRRVVESANCADLISNTVTVTVNTVSVDPVTLTASSTAVCDAGSVDFTVSGGSLGTGAQWELFSGSCGGTLVGTSATSTISTIPVTTTTDYYVLADGTCNTTGCAPGITIDFSTSSVLPTGVTSSAGTTLCAGSPTTLSITGGTLGTGANWEWYDGGCGTGSNVGSSASINVSPTVTTTYYVRSESPGCGPSACESITITVTPGHVLPSSINASNNNFCVGGSVDLTQVGGTPAAGADWVWYEGGCGVGTSIGTGNTVTGLTPLVTTTYYVRAEGGSCGNSVCMDLTITVDQLPTTANAGLDIDLCGTVGALSANSPSIGTGAWSTFSGPGTADAPTSNNSSMSNLSYVTPSVFEWTVTNGSCPASSSQVTVNAYEAPSLSVAGLDQTICDATTANLAGNVPTVGTGIWTVLAGSAIVTTPGSESSGVTGLSLGTNTFQWSISNGTCTPETSTVDIVVEESSTDPASAFASNPNVCIGQSTTLQVSGGTLGTGADWVWYEGSTSGPVLGTGSIVSTPPLSSTTTYIVQGEGNCNTTASLSVTVTAGAGASDPTAATAINDNLCPGDTAEIYVTGAALSAGYEWVWYTGACGAIPVGIGDTISVMPTTTTTYYVRATGTCGNTNCESVTVTVLPGSVAATGVLFDDNNFCSGGSSNLTVDGGSLETGAQWTWYENSCGGTAIGTGATINVTPTSTTSYYARAEGGTCGNTICVDVSIGVLDADAYIVPFESSCGIGASFELNNGLPEGGVYSGVGVSNGVFYPDSAGVGIHTITYEFTEDNGCVAMATADIELTASSINASVLTEVEACADGGVTLVATAGGGSGFYTYSWSNGSTGNPLTYVEPGTYSVTILDGQDCATTVSGIEVSDELACLEVANTFTPNGDGVNDTWNLDFTNYSNASVTILSKWGTVVYQTDGLTINWDGNGNDGSALSAGTYYYIIELDGGATSQNGPITIVK